ncbi:MAG: hypothetical protein JOS17DRAFT_790876 [Linnemannia elongata]|nr:MAG: hypothetical protein JOS17DRAFT_790876 [Linnemannia elongata]
MRPWLSQSSGSGTGNGIESQAPIYCSMLVLTCTLFLTRLYNYAHILLDSRHDLTSLLRPISTFESSLQHSLPQRRMALRAATKAAAVVIPALSTTIQAAPATIPDVPLDINLPTHSSSSSASTSSTSTSTKKSTKTTHTASPTPSPGERPSPETPSPQTTGTSGSNDSPPSAENSHAPSQARVGAGTAPSDASHYNPLTTASGLFGDSSSGPGIQNGILPNNDPHNTSSSTTKNNMSPTTMISASLGSIAAVVVLVVGALVVRRKIRSRHRSQEDMDFEGLGAYPSGATVGGGGKGKGKKRQQKTDYHVGLASVGSTVSSVGGGGMATTGIKKPVPLAQREQFWNP